MSNKIDLTQWSDSELSDWVYNDESLYLMRHNREALEDMLKELFIFTADQLTQLHFDLDEEEEEE